MGAFRNLYLGIGFFFSMLAGMFVGAICFMPKITSWPGEEIPGAAFGAIVGAIVGGAIWKWGKHVKNPTAFSLLVVAVAMIIFLLS
jgi:xanthosine utilization system XapX-like protein